MAKENDKSFLPDSLLGWLTVVTLSIGIAASLYGVFIKPYRYIIGLENRIVRLEDKLDDIGRTVEVIYNYIENKSGF